MTRRDILYTTEWDEFDMGVCKLFVPFFNQYIPFVFFQNHEPSPKLTDKMILALNAILVLEKEEQSVYFEAFGTLDAPKVQEIHIDHENDRFESIYSQVIMSMDSGEYLCFIVKDGKIIHIDRDGTYLDALVE
jgi:hypothetical protein